MKDDSKIISLLELLVIILLISALAAVAIALYVSQPSTPKHSEQLDTRTIHFVQKVLNTTSSGLCRYQIAAPSGSTVVGWGRPGIEQGEEVKIIPQRKGSHLVSKNRIILISNDIAGSSQ